MPIVQTFDGLEAITNVPRSPWWGVTDTSLSLYGLQQTYAEIYRTQPNVRICVDFLSRNLAQLALHVFRRVSDTDRVRLVDHELARWLKKPNPRTTTYRLFENLMGDMGVYFTAAWLKVPDPKNPEAIGLVRLHPATFSVTGGLLPQALQWTVNGRTREFPIDDCVYFNGYNPACLHEDNPLRGLSPMETLRNVLAEEQAASDQRRAFWLNASRHDGVIERPSTAPKWTKEQKQAFREQWQSYSAGGFRAGMSAVLEDGMTYKSASFSARDSEFTAGGKLRREVCAAAYHIPLPLVGILEHATFSNVKEQHKHLYQDTLGPWCEMISQEIEAQLLVECRDQQDVYTEFNIAEKLKGSFEEMANALQVSVGRPIMTANEGRARLNLPRIDNDPSADRLAAQQGGPASNTQPVVTDAGGDATAAAATGAVDDTGDGADAIADILVQTKARQLARVAKADDGERADAFLADLDRWNRELIADLTPSMGADEATRRAHAANLSTWRELQEELV